MQLFRHCRQQQAKFDNCVLDKLGWVRPDLGELSKVRFLLGLALVWGVGQRAQAMTKAEGGLRGVPLRIERV